MKLSIFKEIKFMIFICDTSVKIQIVDNFNWNKNKILLILNSPNWK